MQLRQATIDDTRVISDLFCARIEKWQRMDAKGHVQDLDYASLSVYERWLHGGPWMSIETAAIWLSHLIRSGGLLFVAEINNTVVGYAEVQPGSEPSPIGQHWHLADMVVHSDYTDQDIETELLRYLIQQARGVGRMTVSLAGFDSESIEFFKQFRFAPIQRIRPYQVRAKTGQGFYKAANHANADPAQIRNWYMPVGRISSSRRQWETLWPSLWDAIPQITARKAHRQRINIAGQDIYLCCHQQLYDPRSADIYCWTPKPLTAQVLIAIRDWAHRADYRMLSMTLTESDAKLLGTDAEANPNYREIFATQSLT